MKIALITGGSRGIGLAIARKLAKDGFRCILVARDSDRLEQAAQLIEQESGQASITLPCDIRDENQVTAAVSQVADTVGIIHVLVNCAGRAGGGITSEISSELWRDVMATNLDSVFFVTRSILSRKMMPSGGRIINIASTGGKQGVVHGAPYSASKHGVIGLTKAWGLELAKNGSGITVNAICPGFVATEMAQKVISNYAGLWGISENLAKQRIEERIPLGRYIEPEEVAAMVAYLASENAGGVTAQALNICGGLGSY